jgi:hypothetical protein
MTIAASDTTLTITFVRKGLERWCTILLAFVALMSIFIGVRINVFPQVTELVCDRGKDACALRGPDIMGGSWSVSFPASAMRASRIARDGEGDPKWMLDMVSRPSIQLGNPTGRKAQQDEYAAYAPALQAFIDDRTQPDFAARFASIGGPGLTVWVLVWIALTGSVLRLIHGWRTQITLDRAKLEILRFPALFAPARKSLPITGVMEARGRKGGLFLFSSYVPTITLEILGRDRRVLFSRAMLANRQSAQQVQADIEAINRVLRDASGLVPPAGG